jgi:O-methyltransferase
MRAFAGRMANSVLRPLGYEIERAHRFHPAIKEVEALCRQVMFPAIPPLESRGALLAELQGTPLVEALFLLNELSQTMALEGDICEFGIAQGATSALMANEIRGTSKKIWLFDSFKGLPKPSSKDKLIDDIFNLGTMEQYEGKMAVGKSSVLSRMKAIDFPLERVMLVPGFIEETSKKASLPAKISFAYIDFDFYEPIVIGLKLVAPRLPLKGRIMVDDYGFFSEGAQVAVDEFMKETGGAFELQLPPEGSGHFAMLHKVRE